MKKIILTGDRPTGPLHIGHYFGSLLNRKALEDKYQTYLMIADLQALTDYFDNPEKIRQNILEVALDNLALGLDMNKTTIFIQSQIPQIAELTVFYSNLITINKLKHNPTVKAEINQKFKQFGKKGENLSFGFLGYPVSQAADITVVCAHLVPVGADQLPMIELCRELVGKFHQTYHTDIFPLPEACLSKGKRIKGLDGQQKMSKSLNNCVYLKDSEAETLQRFKRAKTDSLSTLGYDPENRPEVSNLIDLYSLIHDITPQESVDALGPIQYGSFKLKLAEDLNALLRPFRERRKQLEQNPKQVFAILEEGRQRVLSVAQQTLKKVKSAMHLYP